MLKLEATWQEHLGFLRAQQSWMDGGGGSVMSNAEAEVCYIWLCPDRYMRHVLAVLQISMAKH